ncbi:MAG: sigma-70 family RNA polymerase sigma factor [Planctomycetes bacterium]|nr:sigma-70 family RNA polymerase sigma factor [Planctomycetota bacterium]
MATPSTDATVFLRRLSAGDPRAADELLPLVYSELRAVAGSYMNRDAHTLQPTALVHEAFLRMVAAEEVAQWQSRAHFMGVAAKAMRSVLVDHARAKHATKRGGSAERVALDGLVEQLEAQSSDLVAVDDALARLAGVDPELARVVELRFFGGLTIDETARVMETSTATVERAWRTARLWLREQLG